MQSLQMRWPVPAIMGLSITAIAKAATAWPSRLASCISEIFSSSGQPVRLTSKALLRNAPSRSFKTLGAGVLALMVAEDAVVDVIEGLAQVHAGIGEREAVAPSQMGVRQHLRPDAVDGFLFASSKSGVRGSTLRGCLNSTPPEWRACPSGW